eukprot:361719-Chlamydomonas_euryale.AAC.3
MGERELGGYPVEPKVWDSNKFNHEKGGNSSEHKQLIRTQAKSSAQTTRGKNNALLCCIVSS